MTVRAFNLIFFYGDTIVRTVKMVHLRFVYDKIVILTWNFEMFVKDPAYNPVPEERPGGFEWGNAAAAGAGAAAEAREPAVF
jgi:hypothetical protein